MVLFEIVFFFIYRFILFPFGFFVLFVGAMTGNKKFAELFRMRLRPKPREPLAARPIWIHCSSGEFEYAKPVVRSLKEKFPDIPILLTYFSPTYRKNVETFPGVDHAEPMPWDLPGPVYSFLQFYRPRALLISRTDLWPEFLYQARRAKMPIILFSATRGQINWRHKIFGLFFRLLYGKLDRIFCVSPEDKNNFQKLTSTPCEVLGDTRYDQVMARLQSPKPLKDGFFTDERIPILVAGSTWTEDEDVILPALAPLLKRNALRLILVPHEIHENALESVTAHLEEFGLSSVRYSATPNERWQVLVVDTVGVLAELYQRGQIAFVGGSYRGSVHSVMEPLAAGLPTLVGPHHTNNREALEFRQIDIRQGFSPVQNCVDAEALTMATEELLRYNLLAAKSEIKALVQERTGATGRLLKNLEKFI